LPQFAHRLAERRLRSGLSARVSLT
jgi:hypothetical protein